MKLNLEKNFKSLFKKKVSFTMAALTIFAITGAVSLADVGTPTPQPPFQKPLKEDLNPDSSTIKDAITELNKTNAQVNKNAEQVNVNTDNIGHTFEKLKEKADKADMDAKLEKKADKADMDTKLEKKADKADMDAKLEKKADKAEFEEERERSKTADKQQDIGIAENVKEIERLDNEKANYKYVDSVRDASKAALDKEKEERKKEDKALEKSLVDTYNGLNNRLVNEVDSRTKEDAKLATKIKQNKEAIADNKKAIENLDDKVETHDMAIKALKNNKADKVETEKALNNLNENLNNEVKNRKSADRI